MWLQALGILEGEYVLAFKAMNKKDPTTKVKALQEFIALINAKPPSDEQGTNAMLTQWVCCAIAWSLVTYTGYVVYETQ